MAAPSVLAALTRLLRIPELCPACLGASEAGFCAACEAWFRVVQNPCRICGLPCRDERCPRHDPAWRIGRTWVVYEYAEPLAHYLQALKFSHGRALGRAFGLLLAAALRGARERGELRVDALVPVPLSPQRFRERGYNQAAEIARALASQLDLPLALGGVSRPVGGRAQSRLGARARRANVAHAFRVGGFRAGQRLAIVDDVITTGATANALAASLEAAGAERIEAIAVARTIAPDQGPAAPEGVPNR